MHNQQFLNEYFAKTWSSKLGNYIYSGYALLDNISDDDFVIDVGCGSNPFKGKIKNLVGIDPSNIGADVACTIEEYNTDQKFNVAFCLGSINFGNFTIIANQIDKVNSLLTQNARIYWRLNPGFVDHTDNSSKPIEICNQINFYPWTFEKLAIFAKEYGFEQVNCAIDTNGNHSRLYAEWVRE